MTTNTLAPDIELGAVHLTVTNLEKSLAFYQNSLGFKLHRQEGNTAYLGAGLEDLLVLYENAGATPLRRRQTGLYHFAILVPSRQDLAHVLYQFAVTETPIQGASDHTVSEAIYLADPDGNGIEIYRDRPRDQWTLPNGEIVMGTEALDLNGVLTELNEDNIQWDGLASGTKIGHVHLHVDSIQTAEHFYIDVLGFDMMMRYGDMASFLAVGGYHHHLGINTWQGIGAATPPENSVGLRYYVINLPNQDELDAVAERLNAANISFNATEQGILVNDPAGNGILLHV